MTHLVKAERRIPAPAEDLWRTVRQMTGMEDWYPGFIRTSEVLAEDTAQPLRTCVMQDGGELRERILVRDDATRTFVYAIDRHPLPAENVVGTIRIDDLGDGGSHVTWSANLVLAPEVEDQIAKAVQGIYDNGLASLETYHSGRPAV